MRFCVSCRQPYNIQQKAQELKVEYSDIAFIDNYLDKEEKNHYIILKIPRNAHGLNWDKLQMYNEKLENKFYLAFEGLELTFMAKERNIKYYWDSPIGDYFALQSAIEHGVSQLILRGSIMMDIERIKKHNIPVRLVPNQAYNYGKGSGVCCSWIRPEDLELYEEVTESCEFSADNYQKEKALLGIYLNKVWKEDLSFIILGLNENFYAQFLPEGFGQIRQKCHARCLAEPSVCNYCHTMKKMSVSLKEVSDKLQAEEKENN